MLPVLRRRGDVNYVCVSALASRKNTRTIRRRFDAKDLELNQPAVGAWSKELS